MYIYYDFTMIILTIINDIYIDIFNIFKYGFPKII